MNNCPQLLPTGLLDRDFLKDQIATGRPARDISMPGITTRQLSVI